MAHVNFFKKRIGIFDQDVGRHAAMVAYARGLQAGEFLFHNTTPESSRIGDDIQRTAGLIRSGGFGVVVTSSDDRITTSALELLDMVDNDLNPTVLQQAVNPARGEVLMHIGETSYRIIPAAVGQLSVSETII